MDVGFELLRYDCVAIHIIRLSICVINLYVKLTPKLLELIVPRSVNLDFLSLLFWSGKNFQIKVDRAINASQMMVHPSIEYGCQVAIVSVFRHEYASYLHFLQIFEARYLIQSDGCIQYLQSNLPKTIVLGL